MEESNLVRLNKYVASCGITSRRKAAELVKAGMVQVNDIVERNPAVQVGPSDEIKYKGKVIEPEKKLYYILLNKPKDYISTVSDDQGRRTVLDLISGVPNVRLYPVGRLDRATTGLLLITNDGDLTKKLSHPTHKVKKFYQVALDKKVSIEDLNAIEKGLELEDGLAEVVGVDYVRDKPKNEVGIELHMGKNRIVRRIFEHLGYEVKRLDRMYYAGLTKKDLPRGRFRHLTKREIVMLKHFT